MRDLDLKPYSEDEKRVAAFFSERGVGGGDDPIGSILGSHAYLAWQRNLCRAALQQIAAGGLTDPTAIDVAKTTLRKAGLT